MILSTFGRRKIALMTKYLVKYENNSLIIVVLNLIRLNLLVLELRIMGSLAKDSLAAGRKRNRLLLLLAGHPKHFLYFYYNLNNFDALITLNF